MIIRGGENIYPIEIEDVLSSYPGIREAAVVGVADEHWGEIVRAHLILENGAAFDEAAVREYARQHLAAYKIPALFEIQDDFPRNASGKVLKREFDCSDALGRDDRAPPAGARTASATSRFTRHAYAICRWQSRLGLECAASASAVSASPAARFPWISACQDIWATS